MQVEVNDALLAQILHYTNNHPYLIQYLCDRLYVQEEDGHRYLRAIQDDDLEVTHMLASYFQLDFQLLSAVERELLLTVAALASVSQAQLLEAVDVSQRARLPGLLQSLNELGHLRREGDNWIVGSEFLHRWLLINHSGPGAVQEPEVVSVARLDESNVEEVARRLGVTAERRCCAYPFSDFRVPASFFI